MYYVRDVHALFMLARISYSPLGSSNREGTIISGETGSDRKVDHPVAGAR